MPWGKLGLMGRQGSCPQGAFSFLGVETVLGSVEWHVTHSTGHLLNGTIGIKRKGLCVLSAEPQCLTQGLAHSRGFKNVG